MKIQKLSFFLKMILLLSITLLFSCNEQEFFEKEFLAGVAVPEGFDDVPIDGQIIPEDKLSETEDSDSNDGGSDDDNDSDPAIVFETISDSFIQNATQSNKVDILWVIDNSGSMGDEQAALAYNFDVFIRDFISKDVDFKMAITTTDGRDGLNGVMINPADSLTSIKAKEDEAQFISDFANFIQVGTNGYWRETGLKTGDAFLNMHAENFLRRDAFLIVVMISDEEDQSELTVPEFVTKFQAHKDNPGLVKLYSIVNTNLSEHIVYDKYVGKRYMQASEQTSGLVADIKDDFYGILQDMGGTIVDLTDSFALSQIPFEIQDVTVSVNGVEQIDGWIFNTTSNVVKFDEDSLPAINATIEIEYQVEVQ